MSVGAFDFSGVTGLVWFTYLLISPRWAKVLTYLVGLKTSMYLIWSGLAGRYAWSYEDNATNVSFWFFLSFSISYIYIKQVPTYHM